MEALATANNGLKAAFDEFDRDSKADIKQLDDKERELLDRLKKLDEDKLKVAQANGDVDATGEDLVEVNAGGKVIVVSRSTLTQFKGTKLETLFSGRWDKKLTRDSAGRIFLDVNPVCFQAIVDYLIETKNSTDKKKVVPPCVDSEHKESLMHQLNLFGLSDTLFKIQPHLIQKFDLVDQLNDWFGTEDGCDGKFTLLYRLSRDGMSKAFHSKCDDKGPTLTIIETVEGHIIGGFSECRWMKDYTHAYSKKSFLFAISPFDDFEPTKMNLTGASYHHTIYKNPEWGPTFGRGRHGAGYDLRVTGTTLYLNHGKSRKVPSIYEPAPSQIGVSSTLTIKEMEVFQVSPKFFYSIAAADVSASSKEVMSFTPAINFAINEKWVALANAESEIAALESSFNDEDKFIALFSKGSFGDVISLSVCGTLMATTRSTLHIYEDSTLASKILGQGQNESSVIQNPIKEWNTEDVVAWLNSIHGVSQSVVNEFEKDEVTGHELLTLGREDLVLFGVKKRGTIAHVLSEIKKLQEIQCETAIFIEQSAYCFEKIIDHLRLERMFLTGLIQHEPCVPAIRSSEMSRFKKVVNMYFTGRALVSLLGQSGNDEE